MNRTMCPGQDTRYWRPDDIFSIPCGSCGAPVEFFKDDAARRCGKCGTRVANPRLSTGCALWCKHAKECLGYDPHDADDTGPAPALSVADSIMEALKLEFGPGSALVERSLAAHEKARLLLEAVPAEPSVVIPSVLLLLAGAGEDGPARARRIMEEAGVDRASAAEACDLIRAYHSGADSGSPELRILRESYAGRGS